jgi:hypothetical protein
LLDDKLGKIINAKAKVNLATMGREEGPPIYRSRFLSGPPHAHRQAHCMKVYGADDISLRTCIQRLKRSVQYNSDAHLVTFPFKVRANCPKNTLQFAEK